MKLMNTLTGIFLIFLCYF